MIDTAMILLFPFLDFIPFGLPRYWIHRDKLKIKYRYVVVLLTAVSCVNSAAFYLINQEGYEAAARWTTLMRYGFMLFNLMCSFLFTVSIMVFAYFICAVLLYGDVFRYVKVFLRYLGGFIRVFRGFYMDLTLV